MTVYYPDSDRVVGTPFGNDDTPDGTGVRDGAHVTDPVQGTSVHRNTARDIAEFLCI